MSTRRKFLYACLTTAVFALALEGAARLIWMRLEARAFRRRQARGEEILRHDAVNFLRVAHGVYGYTLRPNSQQGDVFINGQGFHQRDTVPIARRAGFPRVICLGESTTFGSSVDNNYPSYLRHILEASGRGYQGYEVINAGVPGWVSDQLALRAEHELAAYKPDAVILYVGWNDFQSYDPTASHPPTISYFELEYGRSIWKQYATSWLKSVALASAWYHSRTLSARELHDAAIGPHEPNPPAECYRFLLADLDRMGAAFRKTNPGVRIFLCTLVCRWPHGSIREWAHTPGIWWMMQHHVLPEEGWSYLPVLNNQLRGFARGRNLPLIDAAAAFENLDRARLLWDWAHMRAEGYELLAWTMYDGLRREGVVEGDAGARESELLAKYRLAAEVRR